ncbi:disulfide bond formation protein B [Alkanindiges sp. WGS2144]|uniref:disulfide bond formation protein B n=1 Tax=Alkanindiges sp. WGS2144 TaxID=3366808 RepID=UPI003751CBE1
MRLPYWLVSLFLFLASIIGMLFALYLQYYQHLDPCPLCIFQRMGLMAMGLISLIAFIHTGLMARQGRAVKRWIRASYALLSTLAIGWSFGVATRHVWLQHLPADEVPACGPGLDYWLDTFPLKDVVHKVLQGSGECAAIDWTFLGQSLPTWSLVFFTILLLINLWQLVRS